ncbi:MAG: hypothetical protein L3K00_08300 [Thermoplasmata archaeon]|nr:hypothetical protein [Thermoplasmata archaeon]
MSRRVDTVLHVARAKSTAVELEHISQLLPLGGPDGAHEVRAWFDAHPSAGILVDGRVALGPMPAHGELESRRARGERFLRAAQQVAGESPEPVQRLIRCLAVTGSTAYGDPAADDDLDFLLVTRRGALWPVLLYEYIAARFRRPSEPGGPSHRCFNYVVDDATARAAFGSTRDFLFAREALTARPVLGAGYYRALVGSGRWMENEVPRLYATWRAQGLPDLPADDPAPALVRAANVALFPLLATYLVLVGMVRSHRYRPGVGRGGPFRVEARLGRMVLATEQFESLRRIYDSASARSAPEGA